ncbi:MAG: thioredoxin domain-containing protein [Candidatus Rokubacteria bacterium]|nr:thioredoxin domain-containing protein [Candidatus Rokubacteria bacterium]
MTRPRAGVVIGILWAVAVLAPAPGTRAESEIEGLRVEIAELRRELRELKELLRQTAASRAPAGQARPATSGPATIAVRGHPGLGRADAPVTLVEFSSYQCPFCRRHFERVLPEIKRAFVDEGKVRYVFRDFPLPTQPDSSSAAKAAWCAGQEGKYWEMHDTLFRNQRDLSVDALKRYALGFELDATSFTRCLDGPAAATAVEQSAAEGAAAGVRGTPTFFIGRTDSNGNLRGRPLIGAQPFAAFKEAIERELEQLATK